MKRVIWKYEITSPECTIEMPMWADVLRVGCVGQGIFVWAIVTPGSPKTKRSFKVFGTGHEIDDPNLNYVGSDEMEGGLQWHVFEA